MSTKTWRDDFEQEYWGKFGSTKTINDIKQFISDIIAQTREETLKELIREYQDNELDGKGYDFYFSIRAKIDELNKLKK